MSLRLVFMGTPDFAVPTLVELVGGGHDVVAVYTRAPQPAGRRGLDLKPSAVALAAQERGLSIFTPGTLREPDAADKIRTYDGDIAIVVAYGLILPKPILKAFRLGCLNLHASLLPRWRGAAPINRAVMAGDPETGVTVMRMDEGLDTGPIAKEKPVPIEPNTTAGELHDTLAQVGARLMLSAVNARERGTLRFKRQPTDAVIYANKISKEETRIDWKRPCDEVHNHCRGLSPFPGAWFEASGLGRVKVLRTAIAVGEGSPGQVLDNKPTIACGNGAVRLVELQRAGGKAMPAEAFWRGVAGCTVLS